MIRKRSKLLRKLEKILDLKTDWGSFFNTWIEIKNFINLGTLIRKRSKSASEIKKDPWSKTDRGSFFHAWYRDQKLYQSRKLKKTLCIQRESFVSFYMEMEATPRVELGVEVLQTSALPLGYVAIMERKTRLELATPTLARLCSTTELLPHYGDPGGTWTPDLRRDRAAF